MIGRAMGAFSKVSWRHDIGIARMMLNQQVRAVYNSNELSIEI